jgi:hypothetical protein
VDIVIEGKITVDEGLVDILQTVLDLKTVANPVLRLTSTDEDLQGRIGFGLGGFILGGRISGTDETGYPAVRRLLGIRNGTYAILDAGRNQLSDLNQTLWIKGSRIVGLLPATLPESPQSLLDGADLDTIQTSVDKAQYDPMDLRLTKHQTGDVVRDTESKSRSVDVVAWRNTRWYAIIFLALVAASALVYFWDQIFALFQPH